MVFGGGLKMVSPPNKNLDKAIIQRDRILMDPNVLLCIIDHIDFSTTTYYRNCRLKNKKVVSQTVAYITSVLEDLKS